MEQAISNTLTPPSELIPKGFNRSFEELKVYVGKRFTLKQTIEKTHWGQLLCCDELDEKGCSKQISDYWPVGKRGLIEAISWHGYGCTGGWWINIEAEGRYEVWEAGCPECGPDELFPYIEFDPPPSMEENKT
ncbi:hypothetical protein BJI67_08125 [Acidihalobacter aeolianus]|uniref:Uncharacterized protein n=1 Tax=Acidihalobacter aeolianus TaxID=2792603 RepID=A0A1D8K7W8_9GAMM|nr:hypothetical protein [Acidihalobacter aeolianus]AOV17028.1 hypothetical protein BJI67_08125 [Acidihalobacter aeolianus]